MDISDYSLHWSSMFFPEENKRILFALWIMTSLIKRSSSKTLLRFLGKDPWPLLEIPRPPAQEKVNAARHLKIIGRKWNY